MGAATWLWHLEGRGRGRLSRCRAGVSGLGERLGALRGVSQPCLQHRCLRQGWSGDGMMGWSGCYVLQSV